MAVSSPDTQQRMLAYQATEHGALRRFRNPAPYDVLSGRGGQVNSHFGNKYFREIVRGRKVEYNMARKERKAEICREVMAHVAEKGGTFLVKENESSSSSAFWTEQSDERTMAKVSQALREGAPKMRETLGTTPPRQKRRHYSSRTRDADDGTTGNNNNRTKRARFACTDIATGRKQVHPSEVTPPLTYTTATTTDEPASDSSMVMPPPLTLSSSSTTAVSVTTNPKILQRSASTISLTGILDDSDGTLLQEDFVNPFGLSERLLISLPGPKNPSERSHSLCLSDISAHPNFLVDDFVNPFDNDDDDDEDFNNSNQSQFSFSRQTSNASDLAGLGSLLYNDQQRQQFWRQQPPRNSSFASMSLSSNQRLLYQAAPPTLVAP